MSTWIHNIIHWIRKIMFQNLPKPIQTILFNAHFDPEVWCNDAHDLFLCLWKQFLVQLGNWAADGSPQRKVTTVEQNQCYDKFCYLKRYFWCLINRSTFWPKSRVHLLPKPNIRTCFICFSAKQNLYYACNRSLQRWNLSNQEKTRGSWATGHRMKFSEPLIVATCSLSFERSMRLLTDAWKPAFACFTDQLFMVSAKTLCTTTVVGGANL